MMNKKRVLFLCTGNSARSQMAEGMVRHCLGDKWEAYSAGIAPAGQVHPLAIQAMSELGIDISGQRPKSVAEFRGADFDLVVTVCDNAAKSCPIWLGRGRVVHIPFPDPVTAAAKRMEPLSVFREVRDAIREQILGFLEREGDEPEGTHPPQLYLAAGR